MVITSDIKQSVRDGDSEDVVEQSDRAFVKAVRSEVNIIGSSDLRTTIKNMKQVLYALEVAGLRIAAKLGVGGALVTRTSRWRFVQMR